MIPEPKPQRWDTAEEQVHHRYLWPAIRKLLPPGEGLDILDVGCGNGFICGQLYRLGHRVTGVDVSREAIELARRAHPGARFDVASAYEDLCFLNPAGWHITIASEVIEHLYDPPQFLRNVHGLLRPGGHLILTTPYHGYLKNLVISLIGGWDRHFTAPEVGGHIKFFSFRTLSELLKDAGFGGATFNNAGRLPWLWKSMVCRSERVEPAGK